MGLNSRKAQVVMGLLPLLTLSLFAFFPFVWRALKTKRPGDIRTAVIFSVAEVGCWIWLVTSPTTHNNGPDNAAAGVTWLLILAAVIAAAWLYRPLDKEERMDQATQNSRPGSSYL